MRIQDSIWQGSFGCWQTPFIHQNLLAIGYAAWNGFLTIGRGIVVCHVDVCDNALVNWSIDPVQYDLQFIAQLQVVAYLERLELEPNAISKLLQVVATYNPSQAIVVLLTGNGQIEINLLQNLAIAPAECYAQVRQRWDEFQLCMTSRRH